MLLQQPRSTLFPYTTLFRSKTYDESIAVLQNSLEAARLGETEKNGGFERLHRFVQLVEQRYEPRSEEHTSELQSPYDLVCRLLLEKKTSIKDAVKLLLE